MPSKKKAKKRSTSPKIGDLCGQPVGTKVGNFYVGLRKRLVKTRPHKPAAPPTPRAEPPAQPEVAEEPTPEVTKHEDGATTTAHMDNTVTDQTMAAAAPPTDPQETEVNNAMAAVAEGTGGGTHQPVAPGQKGH